MRQMGKGSRNTALSLCMASPLHPVLSFIEITMAVATSVGRKMILKKGEGFFLTVRGNVIWFSFYEEQTVLKLF